MSSVRKLLLVDEEVHTLRTLEEELTRRGYQVACAQSGAQALRALEEGGPVDVVITDLHLPEVNGLELTRRIKARWREIEVIVLTAHATIESAVEAIKLGAFHYLVKPFSPEELLIHLAKVEDHQSMCATVDRLRSALSPSKRSFGELVGNHPSMLDLFRTIEHTSRLRLSVLIIGESGTGKELVARAIHQSGPQAGEPFVGINCGAFTRSLLEDQLFGHVRGAFTGAVENQEGVFQAAGRGTLFLDEITEIDVDLQGRLLRAIQEREVIPLGTNQAVPWEARLIAATNRDLEEAVERGLFRKDLFYRINVLQIRIPPLRERMEDIPLLAESFLEQFAVNADQRKKISPQAMELLLRHTYPGNVRELRNALERAHALGLSPVILPEDLPRDFHDRPPEGFKPLAELEREHILRALRLAGGRKTLAAKFLQIDRNRLNRMIKRYGISAGEVVVGQLN